jgi:uncharacterized protein
MIPVNRRSDDELTELVLNPLLASVGDERVFQVAARAKSLYSTEDPSHDWAHVQRVVKSCLEIGRNADADLSILIPSALLHDIVNLGKDHPRRIEASYDSAIEAAKLLSNLEYQKEEVSRITTTIVEHSYSARRRPSTIEAAVLQDSDRLDALGAIGILRATTSGCRLGSSYYDPVDPFAQHRERDDRRYTLDHFYIKLLRLSDTFHTEIGKDMAMERVTFIRQFLAELRHEIGFDTEPLQAIG